MLTTAIILKVLYVAGGAVIGWAAKHWHVATLIEAARREIEKTPTDRPK